MRLAVALLLLLGFGCAPGSVPPREESRPPAPAADRADGPRDSLARADELVARLELQALGNEPFWSVEITRQRIVYRDPEHLDGIPFPYVPPAMAGSRLVFESSRPDSEPHVIRVSIEERACSDGMSDLRYRYASEVRLDSLDLRGCARYRPKSASAGS